MWPHWGDGQKRFRGPLQVYLYNPKMRPKRARGICIYTVLQGVVPPTTDPSCLGFSLVLNGGLTSSWNFVESLSRRQVCPLPSGAFSFSQREILGKFPRHGVHCVW